MKRDVPPPGTVLGERYRVIRPLGSGAFGNVLEVEHVHTRHHRAMKLLNEEAANNPEVVERFLREASAAGRIGDRHIVETFDAGRFPDGAPYLVMELLDGVTLRALLHRDRQLSVGLACELAAQAAQGIHAAHQAGIVHRDLKPENLFVLSGPLLKILDFGVSRFSTGDDLSLTQSNTPMGTPLYMPPEQFQGAKNLGREADIYALGVVLYELLCGSPPFVADSYGALAIAVATSAPAPLSQRVDGLNPELEKIVARAMARERSARFVNAEEFAKALAPFRLAADTAPLPRLEVQPIAPASPDEPTYKPPQKATPMQQSVAPPPTVPAPAAPPSRVRWVAIALGVALLSVGGWLAQHRASQPLPRAPGPILVLPASAKADWRELLATEVIHRALSLSDGATLVPLADAERLRREARDWPADALGASEAAAARQAFGAGPVLLVAVRERGPRLDLEVSEYFSAETGSALERSQPITSDDVSASAIALAHELRAPLELRSPSPGVDEAMARTLPHAAAQLYAQGLRELDAMNLVGAIDDLERAAKKDDGNPLVLDALAAAYDAAGRDDQAMETARLAQTAAQAAPRGLMLQIECRLRGFEHDVKLLQQSCGALLSGRDSLEARLLYANGLARAERWSEAEAVLGAAPQGDPGVLLARARMASVRHQFERERDVGRDLLDAGRVRQSPSITASGFFADCDADRELGQPDAAYAECNLALNGYDFADDLVGQARAHAELGHLATSHPPEGSDGGADAEEYAQSLELAIKAGSKRDVIGSELHLAELQEQPEAARTQFASVERQATEIRSGELESYAAAQLGEAEMKLSNFPAARSAFERALAAAQHAHLRFAEGFARCKLGRLQWQIGELEDAETSLTRANELLGPDDSSAYRVDAAEFLADVLADRGKLAQARTELNRARTLIEPDQQRWLDADALRYSFEAGEAIDAKAAEAVAARFEAASPREWSGDATALAFRALAEASPTRWAQQAEAALAKDASDADTTAWVSLALAEAWLRAGQKSPATRLIAGASTSHQKRLELWSALLSARVSESPARVAQVAAKARRLGYLALAARAEHHQ